MFDKFLHVQTGLTNSDKYCTNRKGKVQGDLANNIVFPQFRNNWKLDAAEQIKSAEGVGFIAIAFLNLSQKANSTFRASDRAALIKVGEGVSFTAMLSLDKLKRPFPLFDILCGWISNRP